MRQNGGRRCPPYREYSSHRCSSYPPLVDRGSTPLFHLHPEIVPRYGGGVLFDDQVVVRWIQLQGERGEQGGHRDQQLHFGDASPQAGMVTQAKWRVGTRLAMLVARRAEPIK